MTTLGAKIIDFYGKFLNNRQDWYRRGQDHVRS